MSTEVDSEKYLLPSAGFSITVRLKIKNVTGTFARAVQYLAECGASVTDVSLIYSDFNYFLREITINAKSEQHSREIVQGIGELKDLELIEWRDDTLEMHKGGKLEVLSRVKLRTTDDLSRAYTPGVARICTAIAEAPEEVYSYTMKSSTVAVVSDGTAVLGLGDIGPEAALPVMEGKAVLFKDFANVDAVPICLSTKDTNEIIETVERISPVFGGINLEDISAPRCFEIENILRERLSIPVFHDDQHGTAVVVLAGLFNALKLVDKPVADIKVVVNGFGAGGVACTRMLLSAGVKNIVPCDRAGIVYRGRPERMNPVKEELIQVTNPDNLQGTVADALDGADVFIGVSKPGAITPEDVKRMARDPIIFALANPIPEILPDEIKGVARVIATGRSDYANQVNNVLCFPGMFRGALDCRASDITDGMKIAAAKAIAGVISDDELHETQIIPSVFRGDVAGTVAAAVKEAAVVDGVAREA